MIPSTDSDLLETYGGHLQTGYLKLGRNYLQYSAALNKSNWQKRPGNSELDKDLYHLSEVLADSPLRLLLTSREPRYDAPIPGKVRLEIEGGGQVAWLQYVM